ncbi:hypothetical protein VNO77_05212 [Canavalia gladiata]|uniref:RING-type E3 ubiquitin transferase n=1 Tax=Canavalia gladiata TaxID=3824 RepID=A0AAN9N4G6_CANGL
MFNMTNAEERIARCYVRVCKTDLTDAKPRNRDFFRFVVTATIRCFSNYFWRPRFMTAFTLFQTSVVINCKDFFQDNEDLLRRYIPNLQSSPFFTSECIDQMTQRIIILVHRLFDAENLSSHDSESADSQHQELALTLDIVLDLQVDGEFEEMERSTIEEYTEQCVMVPASDKAIQSLQTFNLPPQCSICMNKFYTVENEKDEDFNLSLLPCGHVFHHQCIVKWLQISRTCPLCRYPVPTVKD